MTIELAPSHGLVQIRWFTNMLLSRECDRREGLLVRQGAGLFHVGAAGHEALSAIAYALDEDDYIFSYYRDRPMMIARGYPVEQIALDFFGRARSSSHGANLPGHYSSRSLNVFPVATPTGSQCLPAVGAAWSLKRSGSRSMVVTTIGDAATREGEFYEAVCFAVQEQLPILFVVEDNGFGISTPTAKMSPLNLGVFEASLIQEIDARSFVDVFSAGERLVKEIKDGSGPRILWCHLDRLCSHTSSDDHSIYRSPEEIMSLKLSDPITLYGTDLLNREWLTETAWTQLNSQIAAQVENAYKIAADDALPSTARVLNNLFGAAPLPEGVLDVKSDTMVSAVNHTLRRFLETDERVLLFGQDIEDPKGGVFGFTKGLSKAFPNRVVNSPLAEATIMGAGIGLAAVGGRPIFEVQFIDFIAPAYQQLSAQAATLRWRSNGAWKCPLIIYAPYGAYLPSGGPWHSQSNEALLAHIPGIRIAIPSTPADVTDLFEAAMLTEDPAVILIPKHTMRAHIGTGDVEHERLGFGKARVVTSGDDITLITWGNTVHHAHKAVLALQKSHINVELIDLRTIVPCDWETITKSVLKTGRVVVVQEDNRTCGFGQSIITELVSNPVLFARLSHPPVFLARPDTHVPFYAALETEILPGLNDIIRTCNELCGITND